MNVKKCAFLCDLITLLEKHGDYRFVSLPIVPGGAVVVPAATWLHCNSCDEDILSAELARAINAQCGRA